MDNETLKLIARLKIASARLSQPIDVVRFAADRGYARASLQRYTEAADEEGVMLALQLMDKLGMTAAMNRPEPAPEPESRPAPADTRYVGRLR